jgi:hypothetical protein
LNVLAELLSGGVDVIERLKDTNVIILLGKTGIIVCARLIVVVIV